MQHDRSVDRHVGERIRSRRAELGLTQHDLASTLGISYQQVQKYETGSNRVSAGRLYDLSRRLGCHVGYFFDGLEPSTVMPELGHGGQNRTTIELARNFNRLPTGTVKGAISSLVRALADGEETSIQAAAHRIAAE
ncbi:helix-turn-helix domain-containing protein [Minwuia thermotolerans]|uniref:XRE family transcriptional regulator n=1 Tax=Minwuia thermotolerans TaxID=2056226 RepID=A0A2M9G264_9PROT|nr:helix-turn-helix transcriptional regulator [Minwuia thermotolerans]PJK29776.1 XRE family transcriptional regulator [Minwuia thermotolerans]